MQVFVQSARPYALYVFRSLVIACSCLCSYFYIPLLLPLCVYLCMCVRFLLSLDVYVFRWFACYVCPSVSSLCISGVSSFMYVFFICLCLQVVISLCLYVLICVVLVAFIYVCMSVVRQVVIQVSLFRYAWRSLCVMYAVVFLYVFMFGLCNRRVIYSCGYLFISVFLQFARSSFLYVCVSVGITDIISVVRSLFRQLFLSSVRYVVSAVVYFVLQLFSQFVRSVCLYRVFRSFFHTLVVRVCHVFLSFVSYLGLCV